jgi:hypothetical protein
MNTQDTNELQNELNQLATEEKQDVVIEVTGFELFGNPTVTENKHKE